MKWIFIIAIGFICIACPILLFLYIWFLPMYAIISCFAWLILSIISASLVKGDNWYDQLIIPIIITLVFTIILNNAIANSDSYMFDENTTLWYFAPALTLPLIYFVGVKIHEQIDKKRKQKHKLYISEVEKQINKHQCNIAALDQQLKNKASIVHLLSLNEICGADVSEFKNNPNISNITILTNRIKEERDEIGFLEGKLKQHTLKLKLTEKHNTEGAK